MVEKSESIGIISKGKASIQEQNLFVEYEEANESIKTIIEDYSSTQQKDEALARLRRIYDKYLEYPSLLDRHVCPMVSALVEAAKKSIHNRETLQFSRISHPLSAIYALSKVRGRKHVQKFLSHEVGDLEPVLQALKDLAEENIGKGAKILSPNNADQPQTWESLYVLWNWLGTLSLVPFDSQVVLADKSLLLSLIELGKRHLSATGPIREAAAASLASWLCRPDLEKTELPRFVSWSHDIVQDCCSQEKSGRVNVFLALGAVHTLVTILKVSTSSREKVVEAMERLWNPFIQLAESPFCESNLLLRRMMVKWWSRMGCAHLPPQVAPWRYSRGRRSLAEDLQNQQAISAVPTFSFAGNDLPQDQSALSHIPDQVEDAMGFVIQYLSDFSTLVRWSAAKGIGRLTERLPSICADDVLDAILELFVDLGNDKAWHGACLALAELARRGLLLPNRLAEVLPLIIQAIQYDVRRGQTSVGAHVRDAACYCYWAFARAYDPSVLRPFVPELSKSIILTCLFDREVNCRRAASAAFQECVGRQGADNFKHGISILTRADYFALGNQTNSFTDIAIHVAQFPEYRRKILNHVYRVKLHHWDLNVRELSSKTLYGLTSLDPKYVGECVIPSLLRTCLDPKDIPVRHGSILGLAETVRALGDMELKLEGALSKEILADIAEIVPTIEKLRLYRGRGGEIVRAAVCRLIFCICESKLPMVAGQQVRHLDSIDACLSHPNADIQEKACQALCRLTANYFPVSSTGPSERLQKRIVDKYTYTLRTCENPASTRGFALALGHLPRKLLSPSPGVLDTVVESLCRVSRYDAKVGSDKDAETRRNALIALRYVCQTTLGASSSFKKNEIGDWKNMNTRQIARAYDAFFAAVDDYNVDRRGDVGSWCRMEAMRGLEALTYLTVQNRQSHGGAIPTSFIASICPRVVAALLKQLSEKLDSARVEAGLCLYRILNRRNPEVPFIPRKSCLIGCFDTVGGCFSDHGLNWADASCTFPMVGAALEIPEFFPSIIAGMVISVGGLTESVAKYSKAALLSWTKNAKGGNGISDLGDVLLRLFKAHSRQGRVILPLLKTIDFLLSHQCLDDLILGSDSRFKASLLFSISTEAKNCSDVHRLLACMDVALGLVNGPCQEQDEALAFVCTMLCHRYPRVRRYAAEHIYVSLLENPDLIQDDDAVLDYLLTAPWDLDMNLLQRREMAEKVAKAAGITLPDLVVQSSSESAKKNIPSDDFASYSSLIENITR